MFPSGSLGTRFVKGAWEQGLSYSQELPPDCKKKVNLLIFILL